MTPSSQLPLRRRATARLTRLAGAALAAGALLGLAGLAAAQPAFAHDELLGSTPENGEVFDTAPEQVELTFSNDVIAVGSVIEVVDHHAEPVETGETTVLGPVVSAALPADLSGEYQVRWRVVSSDGHPIEGTIDFGVGADATGSWASEAPHDGAGSGEESAEDAGDGSADDATGANGWAITGFVVGALAVLGLVAAILVRTVRRPQALGTGGGAADRRDGAEGAAREERDDSAGGSGSSDGPLA
ncbi:copper resistance CopC family protein [Agromyces sp. G08B096]|uniref:Copper resistance CopC family protein n=1 Tax=Agromyces sp. G08B096 TaxID=3156399 RepID=A0AAU7W9Z6_9MICO